MAQSRTWDVDRVSRNQPTTWPILVHWIKIERLWLNGEEDGASDRAPNGGSSAVRRQRSGRPLRRREGIGKLEEGVAELTRGLETSGKHRRAADDGDRRGKMEVLAGDGAGGPGTQPEAVRGAP